MADYDSFSYEINSRLPEWWKNDALALPVNKYTQDLIANILEEFLTTLGVVQPLNVWKSIPEEYDYYHHYKELDENLVFESEEGVIEKTPVCTFFAGDTIKAYLPNTKRKCDARIHIKLKGGEVSDDKQKIDEFRIQNAFQEIILKDIPKTSTIDILTDSNQILIDGKSQPILTEGSFDKIEPTIKYPDYIIPDIGEIDLEYENKETLISFCSSDTVDFDLQIYLLKPTYTTEQNIRITTVSAFPIEWVRLYGYFCHPFNNKEGYKFLWEKKYDIDSRTVYDRITKQFDCERFYIQVKFHGIGGILTKGFPQEEYSSNPAFETNKKLDKWGRVYGLPRRNYRDDITEDEEPYTFPKYYRYPIEQDYWYEERMVNEYRFDDEHIDSAFVKDSEFNNIAKLECIYPFSNDIWVYTETVDPDSDIIKEISNGIFICDIKEIEEDVGVSIKDLESLKYGKVSEVTFIDPSNIETMRNNSFSYQTKRFEIAFCLSNIEDKVPKDIEIKGIELKFKDSTNLHSNSLRISDDSSMVIPFFVAGEVIEEDINISGDREFWQREKDYYTIGGEDHLFGQKEITREQLFNGTDGKLKFKIGFINESDFLQARLLLEEVSLKIYYEEIKDSYTMESDLSNHQITTDSSTELTITLTKDVNKKIEGKELFIILPTELQFKNGFNHYNFNFDKDEDSFDIKAIIEPSEEKKTGVYDIVVFAEDHECRETLVVRSNNANTI